MQDANDNEDLILEFISKMDPKTITSYCKTSPNIRDVCKRNSKMIAKSILKNIGLTNTDNININMVILFLYEIDFNYDAYLNKHIITRKPMQEKLFQLIKLLHQNNISINKTQIGLYLIQAAKHDQYDIIKYLSTSFNIHSKSFSTARSVSNDKEIREYLRQLYLINTI